MIHRYALVVFFVIAGMCAAAVPALNAESVDVMNQKIMLEAQMENRLKEMLSSFLGTKNVIAVVKISLHDKEQKSKSGSDVSMRKWDENQEMVLPGVPAAAPMTKGETPKKDSNRLGVSSINISVIIGKNLGAEAVDKVKKLVTGTFGLDATAGDTLSVETYAATNDYFGVVAKELPFRNSEVILLLAVGIAALFLFGPFRGFLRNLNENLLKISISKAPAEDADGHMAADKDDIDDDREKDQAPDLQRNGIGGIGGGFGGLFGSQDDALNLGKIISKDNIDDVRLSLANEPPEIIAKVIQRLPAEFALTAVPDGKMAEVMKHFFATSFEKPEDIRAIMGRVKSRVEWSFGGAVRLGRMLQPVEKKAQEEVLSYIRAEHPEFAATVENRLFRFADLLNYDDSALKRIFRKVGAEPFARCMKSLSEDVAQQFNEKLGDSITTLIGNHLKTMVGAGNDGDSEMKILHAIEGLVKKGFIPPLEEVKQNAK